MNHIDEHCPIYEVMSSAMFNSSGVVSCNYFIDQMHIDTPQPVLDQLERYWVDLTVESLNISVSHGMCSKFYMQVYKAAQFFDTPKSNTQIYTRFLSGLPISLVHLSRPEQALTVPTYRYGAIYAAPHPQAGNARPDAGQPDVLQLAVEMDKQVTQMLIKGELTEQIRTPVEVSFDNFVSGNITHANFTSPTGLARLLRPI